MGRTLGDEMSRAVPLAFILLGMLALLEGNLTICGWSMFLAVVTA